MTDTIKNITLPSDTWVDIYADAAIVAAGIAVGTAITVQVVSGGPVKLVTNATIPLVDTGYRELKKGNDTFSNETGDSGAWAYSAGVISHINVTGV